MLRRCRNFLSALLPTAPALSNYRNIKVKGYERRLRASVERYPLCPGHRLSRAFDFFFSDRSCT